jgi:hypothetical protein
LKAKGASTSREHASLLRLHAPALLHVHAIPELLTEKGA